MKAQSFKIGMAIATLSVLPLFVQCEKVATEEKFYEEEISFSNDILLCQQTSAEISLTINSTISEVEIQNLHYMREEEFLAHDVYAYFSEIYALPIFKNITKSEAWHTNLVKELLDKYELDDPAENHQTGIFKNDKLQKLYKDLVEHGQQNLENALEAGATIEDLDIFDLREQLKDTENADIISVYQCLIHGSTNHMKAFSFQLKARNITYTPKYISEEEYREILDK